MTQFDLALFTALNEEYRSKRVVPEPMALDAESTANRARQRTNRMQRQLDLRPGQRVLEVGCGRGQLASLLSAHCDVSVVGVDIHEYEEWSEQASDDVTFLASDVVDLPDRYDGAFDAAYSISVWEHIEHPAAALEALFRLLAPGGVAFIQAQLHPGPKASHRYREVFFPWPHLIFDDEVFEEYYVSIGRPPQRPAWLNRWTEMHYRFHVERIGFDVDWWSTPDPKFDEEFYSRFRERLSQYPRWDLSHDAVMMRLTKPKEPQEGGAPKRARLDDLSHLSRRGWRHLRRRASSVRTRLRRGH